MRTNADCSGPSLLRMGGARRFSGGRAPRRADGTPKPSRTRGFPQTNPPKAATRPPSRSSVSLVQPPAASPQAPPEASEHPRSRSALRPMTLGDGRRIVRDVSGERGTTPEYPDLRRQDMSRFVSAAPPPDLSQHDMDRIAGQRSREDDALQGHKKPSLWKRLLGRRGQ